MTQQPVRAPSKPSPRPTTPPPPIRPPDPQSWSWYTVPFETREVRKARERADRAARRAGRAARRVHEAEERAARHGADARHFVDVAGDAATAALTAVSAAADEAHARLAAKARMRELEHAVITARAGGSVHVSPPTRVEALKLARRIDPGSSGASIARGIGFIVAGIVALVMMLVGGFGWLGFLAPLAIIIACGSLEERIQLSDRNRKAGQIQLELARASLAPDERARAAAAGAPARDVQPASDMGTKAAASAVMPGRKPLVEVGDPQTGPAVIAVLERLTENVRGRVPQSDLATLGRIRDSAALALPTDDSPLNLSDHDTWLVRQICIDYLPGALDHYIALPPGRASEPLLDGRSARQVLDEQLATIERRLEELANRSYRREAEGLLTHARFVTDTLKPDPFRAWLVELAGNQPEPGRVAAAAPLPVDAPAATGASPTQARERS
jgi:hypothetical protein